MRRLLSLTALVIASAPALAETQSPALAGSIWSITPPLLAILAALLLRSVIPALFLGLWLGAWLVHDASLSGLWTGLLDVLQIYVLGAVADSSQASIILFSLMIGGMVGLISRNGGIHGIVAWMSKRVHNTRQALLATSGLGVAIFFDDYANTLVVGNTMRPVTDRMRISREKLAYVVDSTAAPVASLAFVTTWIGYEVGLIGAALEDLQVDASPYGVFLNALPYSFYPLLALAFVFLIAGRGRDFGPMYHAEVRAHTDGKLVADNAQIDPELIEGKELAPDDSTPARAINAVLPVMVLVVTVVSALFVTGSGDNIREIIGNADSYKALTWGSLLGVLTAAAMTLAQRLLSLEQTVQAWYAGMKTMMMAMVILVMAWALSSITDALGTADFLVATLGDSMPLFLLPTLVFVLAALTAFATGSSWSTMGILMPLVIPLAWAMMGNDALVGAQAPIFFSTIACVLAGAVWGDHCSPISDTTILSSMAAGCDHLAHVKTQLPYALVVGGVAIAAGTIPAGFGVSWWLCLPVGLLALWAVSQFVARPIPNRD
jgi:Na+/H+ antiporter NhaC